MDEHAPVERQDAPDFSRAMKTMADDHAQVRNHMHIHGWNTGSWIHLALLVSLSVIARRPEWLLCLLLTNCGRTGWEPETLLAEVRRVATLACGHAAVAPTPPAPEPTPVVVSSRWYVMRNAPTSAGSNPSAVGTIVLCLEDTELKRLVMVFRHLRWAYTKGDRKNKSWVEDMSARVAYHYEPKARKISAPGETWTAHVIVDFLRKKGVEPLPDIALVDQFLHDTFPIPTDV